MLGGEIRMESCMKHCAAALTRLACALISFGSQLNGPAELERCNDIIPSVRRCLTVRACALCDGAGEEADEDGQLTNPDFNTQPTHAINWYGDTEQVELVQLDFVSVVVKTLHFSSKKPLGSWSSPSHEQSPDALIQLTPPQDDLRWIENLHRLT